MATFQRLILCVIFCLSLVSGQNKDARISPVLKSIVIPGTGEFQLNKIERGRAFFLTEGFLWLSYLTSTHASHYQDHTMRSFAADHAGVDIHRKTDQFWIDIGNYASLDAFNAEHARWREVDVMYDEGGTWEWSWDNSRNQKKFEVYRINRDLWALSGKFIIGGIVMNHIISGIDALYLNRQLEGHSFTLTPQVSGSGSNFVFSITL